jgi:hypothetical protein
MSGRFARCFVETHGPFAPLALLMLLTATEAARPQSVKPPPAALADPAPATPVAPDQSAALPPAQPAPPRAENPGLFNEIGKLFDNPSSIFPDLPSLKSPKEAIDDLNARAKDATEGLSRLATPLIVKGRMVCPVAANGGSDCNAASDRLCQSKGFKQGKSLDTDSAQSCSAAALLSGGNRQPGNCQTNYYVTRALCQ